MPRWPVDRPEPKTTSERAYRYREEPAANIIRKLGGVRPLAKKLGLTPEAVSKWGRPLGERGTGGLIPSRHWRKIMDLFGEIGSNKTQQERVYHTMKTALLVSAGVVKKKERNVNAAKEKGDRFERQVAADITAAGYEAHRVPLSGAVPGYAGDVKATTPTGVWIIQCKITTNMPSKLGRPASQAGRGAVVRMLNEAAFGWVVSDNQTYLAMRQEEFLALMGGTRPQAVNVPSKDIGPGLQIAKMIKGHDALLFRRNRERGWMAMINKEKVPA